MTSAVTMQLVCHQTQVVAYDRCKMNRCDSTLTWTNMAQPGVLLCRPLGLLNYIKRALSLCRIHHQMYGRVPLLWWVTSAGTAPPTYRSCSSSCWRWPSRTWRLTASTCRTCLPAITPAGPSVSPDCLHVPPLVSQLPGIGIHALVQNTRHA